MKNCPECNSAGHIITSDYYAGDQHVTETAPCPECHYCQACKARYLPGTNQLALYTTDQRDGYEVEWYTVCLVCGEIQEEEPCPAKK